MLRLGLKNRSGHPRGVPNLSSVPGAGTKPIGLPNLSSVPGAGTKPIGLPNLSSVPGGDGNCPSPSRWRWKLSFATRRRWEKPVLRHQEEVGKTFATRPSLQAAVKNLLGHQVQKRRGSASLDLSIQNPPGLGQG